MTKNQNNKQVDKAQEKRDTLSDEFISLRFLAKVGKLMEQENITKKELANKLNTSPSYVTQLFQGDKLINVRLLTKIKRALNVTIEITCTPILPKAEETQQQLALNSKLSTFELSIDISSNLDTFSIIDGGDTEVGASKETVYYQLTEDNGTWTYLPDSNS